MCVLLIPRRNDMKIDAYAVHWVRQDRAFQLHQPLQPKSLQIAARDQFADFWAATT